MRAARLWGAEDVRVGEEATPMVKSFGVVYG